MLTHLFLELKNCLITKPSDKIVEFERIESKRAKIRR